jgi:hypothetical protein
MAKLTVVGVEMEIVEVRDAVGGFAKFWHVDSLTRTRNYAEACSVGKITIIEVKISVRIAPKFSVDILDLDAPFWNRGTVFFGPLRKELTTCRCVRGWGGVRKEHSHRPLKKILRPRSAKLFQTRQNHRVVIT